MSVATTTKKINLGQLAWEIAVTKSMTLAIPMTMTGGAGANAGATKEIAADVPQSDLDAAIAAHVAEDPEVALAALRQQILTVMAVNRTYLALATPTAAQTTAQVKALSTQSIKIMRHLFSLLEEAP